MAILTYGRKCFLKKRNQSEPPTNHFVFIHALLEISSILSTITVTLIRKTKEISKFEVISTIFDISSKCWHSDFYFSMKSGFPGITLEYLGKWLPRSGAQTKDKSLKLRNKRRQLEVTVIFLSGFSTQEEGS